MEGLVEVQNPAHVAGRVGVALHDRRHELRLEHYLVFVWDMRALETYPMLTVDDRQLDVDRRAMIMSACTDPPRICD